MTIDRLNDRFICEKFLQDIEGPNNDNLSRDLPG